MTDSCHSIGNIIAASARLGLGYAERLLTGVQPNQFARFATVGDTMIESNHPCFILGHLSLYPARVISELGADASAIQPSESFDKLFNKTATCVDDMDGTLYPSMDQVVTAFRSGHQRAIEVLQQTADERFDAENFNEAMREKFPTVGAMHAFYLSGHFMMHMGQMSAWRRINGMGPA